MAKLKVEDYKKWCYEWEQADHDEKVKLCEANNITYETGRHWYSDAPADYKGTGKPKPLRMTVEDIMGMKPGINLDFASFDIETSNLDADFSIMLSAVIKPFGQEPVVFRADDYPEWHSGNRSNDKGIVTDVSNELRRHAIIITHYGLYFDTPFMRAKMVHHDLPPLPPMFAIDSWSIAKKNFKVSSRRLKNLANYFQIGDKDSVDGARWMAAAYDGSKEALDEIVEHNIIDCEVLEKLACLTFPYLKSIPKL